MSSIRAPSSETSNMRVDRSRIRRLVSKAVVVLAAALHLPCFPFPPTRGRTSWDPSGGCPRDGARKLRVEASRIAAAGSDGGESAPISTCTAIARPPKSKLVSARPRVHSVYRRQLRLKVGWPWRLCGEDDGRSPGFFFSAWPCSPSASRVLGLPSARHDHSDLEV
jgi:hypothetical protein